MRSENKNSDQDKYAISVIMPCYNTEKYVAEALDSILTQKFQNFEILCFDDGSTDHTLEILHHYASKYTCMRVFENTNHGVGYERNAGILEAKGKYLYYMDSDDVLDSRCFDVLYSCAENNQLQLLYFDGSSFYETKELETKFPSYKKLYMREKRYPDIYKGEELYMRLRDDGAFRIAVTFQMVRRDYIVDNQLFFPQMRTMEDNLYTIRTLIHANRVKCIPDQLYYRRVRSNSIMTSMETRQKIMDFCTIIKELLKDLQQYSPESPLYLALCKHLQQVYYRNLKDAILNYKQEHSETVWPLEFTSSNVDVLYSVPFFSYLDQRLYYVSDKLKLAYQEKSEINRKLQQTYREKSEINAKLQQTYHEKSELNSKLQQTYHEKSEINVRLKETLSYKEEMDKTISNLQEKIVSLQVQLDSYKKPFIQRCWTWLKKGEERDGINEKNK